MTAASRPEGIAGLLIDEIRLIGVFKTSRGYVAQVRSGAKNYVLRQSDQLFDGDVIAIEKNEVVFKQAIQNPTGPKTYREVVMTLDPKS